MALACTRWAGWSGADVETKFSNRFLPILWNNLTQPAKSSIKIGLRLLRRNLALYRSFFPFLAWLCWPILASRTSAFGLKGRFPMPVGTVKFFNIDKGYGFISPDDGTPDSFVHISAVERAGMATLDKEQRIRFDIEADRRGRNSAVNLVQA
jgi:CspA family cold shock protein